MFTYRAFNLVIGALVLLLAFSSCSQNSEEFTLADTTEPSFEFTDAERAAFLADDDSTLVVDFGDPSLGQTFFEAPPSGDALASLLGSNRAVSSAAKGDKYSTPAPPVAVAPECNKVIGICNMTEHFFKVADCCATTAAANYVAQVEFEDETVDRSGVEVTFKRDGNEVGRANTDAEGVATFTESGVARGPHNISVCVAEDASIGDCDCGCDDEEEECGPCDGKVNKLTLRYNGTSSGLLTVTGGSKKGGSGSFFSGNVAPGGVFSFEAPAGQAFGTNIYLTIGGVESAIHTSCSQPIGPGVVFGDYTVLAGESLNGGPLCAGGDTDGKSSKSGSKDPCYKYNKYYAKYQKALAKYGPEKAAKYLEKANKYKGQCGGNTPPPGDPNCIVGNAAYAPKLTGTELVLGKPSGPTDGPLVVNPNTPITLTAIYHDEWPIATNAPLAPTYTVFNANGQTVTSGTPVLGTAPAGSEVGLKETQYMNLVTVNLAQGLPAGTFTIKLKAYDGDGKGKDWAEVAWTVTNPCGSTPPPPPCDCGTPQFKCAECSRTAEEGFYCATLDFAIYTDCIKGAVTGTGYFPTCNPARVGMRNGMNFRAAYDNGAVQGYLNYWDGGLRITNGQIKWLLISGVHSWFGGDGWMVHVYDGGKTFNLDSFEIWIDDPATCSCYHCGGFLTGCYVNVSYKYTQVCP